MASHFSVIPTRIVFDDAINHTQLRVLAAISSMADEDGITFFKNSKLAAKLKFEPRTLQRNISHLKKHGYLEVKTMSNDNGRQALNLYRVIHDKYLNGNDWEQKAVKYAELLGTNLNKVGGDKIVAPRGDAQCQGEGDAQCHPFNKDKHYLSLTEKEKGALTLTNFIVQVEGSFQEQAFGEFSLTLDEIKQLAYAAYDLWDGTDSFPEGNVIAYFRGYIRQHTAEAKLTKHVKKNQEKGTPAGREDDLWRMRMTGYKKNGWWPTDLWGAEPHQHDTRVPKSILSELSH
tara:strand:+ start:5567 stop:6430 length:864 start_codon:yes stop_codon:yes gene_type:complete